MAIRNLHQPPEFGPCLRCVGSEGRAQSAVSRTVAAERERDAAREELAKVRAELEEYKVVAGPEYQHQLTNGGKLVVAMAALGVAEDQLVKVKALLLVSAHAHERAANHCHQLGDWKSLNKDLWHVDAAGFMELAAELRKAAE